MTITMATAPTRGPDYTMPSGNRGTPIVTAPAASPTVAPDTSLPAMPPVIDITPVVATKKKLAQRYLAASRGAIVPLLPDLPTGMMVAHLAVHAYQAQHCAASDEAAAACAPAVTSAPPPTHASPAAGFDVMA